MAIPVVDHHLAIGQAHNRPRWTGFKAGASSQ
jgi:hypothetical protein